MKYLNGFLFLFFLFFVSSKFVLNSVRSFHWRIYAGTAPVFLSLDMSVYLSVSIPVSESVCLLVCQSVK